jgi:hypothetical protein
MTTTTKKKRKKKKRTPKSIVEQEMEDLFEREKELRKECHDPDCNDWDECPDDCSGEDMDRTCGDDLDHWTYACWLIADTIRHIKAIYRAEGNKFTAENIPLIYDAIRKIYGAKEAVEWHGNNIDVPELRTILKYLRRYRGVRVTFNGDPSVKKKEKKND